MKATETGICRYVQYVYIALRLTTRFRIWDLGQACHTNRFTVQVVTEADSLEQLNPNFKLFGVGLVIKSEAQ